MMDLWNDIDVEEAEARMRGVVRRLAELDDAMKSAQKILAQNRDSFAGQMGLRSLTHMQTALEMERLELVKHRSRECLDVALNGVAYAHHTANLGDLGFFLIRLQKLYTSIAQAISVGPSPRGPISRFISSSTNLKLADVYPSSFGMKLYVKQDYDMFGDSLASSALQSLFNLLSSTSREDEIARMSAEMGPRAINHLRHVLSDLSRSESSFSLSWKDVTGTKFEWSATKEEVLVLRHNSSKFRTENTRDITREGFIVGASLLRDRFELATSDGVIEGKLTKSAKAVIREFFGRRCLATLSQTEIVETMTGENRIYYSLTGIVEVA